MKYTAFDSKSGQLVRKPFVVQWLDDEKTRKCERQLVDPSRAVESDAQVFNRWSGIMAEYQEPMPQHEAEALVAPVLHHLLHNWSRGDADVNKFVLDWFAHLVQRPAEKTNVAIVVFGSEGTGKSIVPKFIRERVMGFACSVHTANAPRDVFGKHSAFIRDAVLVQIDEASNMRRFMDELKDMITGTTLTFEEKFQKIDKCRNFSNFIFTTNDPGAFNLDAVNRRMVLLHSSDDARGQEDFFRELGEAMAHPRAGRAMYQVLMARDLSHVRSTMQFARPITDYQRQVVASSLPPVAVFLSAIVNTEFGQLESDDQKFHLSVTAMHESSIKWVGLWGQDTAASMTVTKFGAQVAQLLGGGLKRRVGCGMQYELSKNDIRAVLERRKSFAEDVGLPAESRATLQLRACGGAR